MHTIQNTLYVMTPQAYVHLENATVRIDVEREKKLQVPLHHIGGLVCFGNVMVGRGLKHGERVGGGGGLGVSPDLTLGRETKQYPCPQ